MRRLIRIQADASELAPASSSVPSSSFYCPSNGLFITFILYEPVPVWPHYHYSTALEFQDNYELHCFNKSLGQPRSLLHLHGSRREIYEGGGGGRVDSDTLQVNIYMLPCEGGYSNPICCLVKAMQCSANAQPLVCGPMSRDAIVACRPPPPPPPLPPPQVKTPLLPSLRHHIWEL